MERLDGKEKWSVVESPRERRSIQTLVQNEAVFVQYLDVGLWHLAFYNDGKDKEVVSFSTVILGRFCHNLGSFLLCFHPPLLKVVIFSCSPHYLSCLFLCYAVHFFFLNTALAKNQ